MPQIDVHRLGTTDLADVARVHVAAFPESVLSWLGTDVVWHYYAWHLSEANQAVAFGAYEDGKLVGFSVGGVFWSSMPGFLRRHFARVAWSILRRPRVIGHPLFVHRIQRASRSLFKRKRRRNGSTATKRKAPSRPYAILSIGTHPEHRRKGLGGLLMDAHERRALWLGHSTMRLTVSPDNHGAVRFYAHRGWQPLKREGDDVASDWRGTMEKDLTRVSSRETTPVARGESDSSGQAGT